MATIREATQADWPTIVSIYNAAVPEQTATADLDPLSLAECRPWLRDRQGYPLWAIACEGTVAGWLAFEPFYDRAAYAATAEVSLYIAPAWRGCGLGQQLLQAAIGTGPRLGFKTLVGLVFEHNSASLRLFGRLGFVRWGYLPRVAELDSRERDLAVLGCRISP